MASLMSVQLTTRRFASLLCQTTLISSQCRMSLTPHTISGFVQVPQVHPLKRNATCVAVAIHGVNPVNQSWKYSQDVQDGDTLATDQNLLNNVRSGRVLDCRDTVQCDVDFCESSVISRHRSVAGLLDHELTSDADMSYGREVIKRFRFTDFNGVPSSVVFLTSSPNKEYMRFTDDVKSSEKAGSSKKDPKNSPNADQLNNVKNFMVEMVRFINYYSKQYCVG